MADTITFFDTEDKEEFEDDPELTMWTEDHTFQPPNSHAIRGVLRLEKDIWNICTVLASNLEEKELIWPAKISWTLSVVKGRKSKDLGYDSVTWSKHDLGKCDWPRCITVRHSDLQKDGMVNADGSVTFMWFAELTAGSCGVASSAGEDVETRSGHKNVRQTDGETKSIQENQELKRESTTEKNEFSQFLLLGKTGSGKSATGNSILGKKEFVCKSGTCSVTSEVRSDSTEVDGRLITIVDGPGMLHDTLQGMDDIQDAIKAAMKASPEGYDAFLIVVRYGVRFTQEDRQAVEFIKDIFGEKVLKKHGILVMTHGDNFKSDSDESGDNFEKWCEEQEGDFAKLYAECEGRVVLFDNKTKDERQRHQQVKQLLKLADDLRAKEGRYTNSTLKNVQVDIDLSRKNVSRDYRRVEIQKELARHYILFLKRVDAGGNYYIA